jgi:hypothetical protein
MKNHWKTVHLVLLLALLLLSGVALARTDSGYDLASSTLGTAAGHLRGGDYRLAYVAGPVDAGVELTGGRYAFSGGVASGGGQLEHNIYLPLLMRSTS